MSGAEQLSLAIMESDGAIVRPNHDLQTQLTGRKERLSFLIKFINDNGVLTKVCNDLLQAVSCSQSGQDVPTVPPTTCNGC